MNILGGIGKDTEKTITTVKPAFAVTPSAGDSWTLYKGQLTLTTTGGSTVVAGIDMRTLPDSSQSDTSAALINHSTALAPQYVDASRTVATWDTMIGGLIALFIILGFMALMVALWQKLDAITALGLGVSIGNITSGFSGAFGAKSQQGDNSLTAGRMIVNNNESAAPPPGADEGKGK